MQKQQMKFKSSTSESGGVSRRELQMRNGDLLSGKEIDVLFKQLEKEFDNDIDTALWYENNYQLLVAVMLSAQMTDAGVNKVTDKLFQVLHQPQDAIQLGFEKLNQMIKSINYHNTKAKHIIQMSQQLCDKFNGEVPSNFDDLISLAGVGRKTANLVMSIAFKKPYIAVDTHVFRVSNRIGLTKATNVVDTELQLKQRVPLAKHREINNLLIPFGRTYCKAINPQCKICPMNGICRHKNNAKKTNKK